MKGEYRNPIVDNKAVAAARSKFAGFSRDMDAKPARQRRRWFKRQVRRGTGYRPARSPSYTKRRQIDRKVEVRAANKRARAARRVTRRRG